MLPGFGEVTVDYQDRRFFLMLRAVSRVSSESRKKNITENSNFEILNVELACSSGVRNRSIVFQQSWSEHGVIRYSVLKTSEMSKESPPRTKSRSTTRTVDISETVAAGEWDASPRSLRGLSFCICVTAWKTVDKKIQNKAPRNFPTFRLIAIFNKHRMNYSCLGFCLRWHKATKKYFEGSKLSPVTEWGVLIDVLLSCLINTLQSSQSKQQPRLQITTRRTACLQRGLWGATTNVTDRKVATHR